MDETKNQEDSAQGAVPQVSPARAKKALEKDLSFAIAVLTVAKSTSLDIPEMRKLAIPGKEEGLTPEYIDAHMSAAVACLRSICLTEGMLDLMASHIAGIMENRLHAKALKELEKQQKIFN